MNVRFGKTGFIIDDYKVVFYHDYGRPWVALYRDGHKAIGVPAEHFKQFLDSFFDKRFAHLVDQLEEHEFNPRVDEVRPIGHYFETEDPEIFK